MRALRCCPKRLFRHALRHIPLPYACRRAYPLDAEPAERRGSAVRLSAQQLSRRCAVRRCFPCKVWRCAHRERCRHDTDRDKSCRRGGSLARSPHPVRARRALCGRARNCLRHTPLPLSSGRCICCRSPAFLPAACSRGLPNSLLRLPASLPCLRVAHDIRTSSCGKNTRAQAAAWLPTVPLRPLSAAEGSAEKTMKRSLWC
ncbi:unknown [Prevotella sp. CAG:255]|nr:unknown [Prevotella sp. CAG:255]